MSTWYVAAGSEFDGWLETQAELDGAILADVPFPGVHHRTGVHPDREQM